MGYRLTQRRIPLPAASTEPLSVPHTACMYSYVVCVYTCARTHMHAHTRQGSSELLVQEKIQPEELLRHNQELWGCSSYLLMKDSPSWNDLHPYPQRQLLPAWMRSETNGPHPVSLPLSAERSIWYADRQYLDYPRFSKADFTYSKG